MVSQRTPASLPGLCPYALNTTAPTAYTPYFIQLLSTATSSRQTTAAAAAVVVVVVVVGGRLLTRRPYRVRRDISYAFFGSSVRTLHGRLTLPKASIRDAAVPGHSVSQCSTVCGSSPHRGHVGSTINFSSFKPDTENDGNFDTVSSKRANFNEVQIFI